MVQTGIFIRAQVPDFQPTTIPRWQSVDIGDPRLDAEQLLKWMMTRTPVQMAAVIRKLHELGEGEVTHVRGKLEVGQTITGGPYSAGKPGKIGYMTKESHREAR